MSKTTKILVIEPNGEMRLVDWSKPQEVADLLQLPGPSEALAKAIAILGIEVDAQSSEVTITSLKNRGFTITHKSIVRAISEEELMDEGYNLFTSDCRTCDACNCPGS